MSNTATQVEAMEDLFRRALPLDLPPERNLYFIAHGSLPDWFQNGLCRGWTGPFADVAYGRYLRLVGRWKGRGYCCVINSDNAFEMVAIGMHEVSHCLERPRDPQLWRVALDDALMESSVQRICDLHDRTKTPPDEINGLATDDTPQWAGHGPRFLRAAIHVHYRMASAGVHRSAGSMYLAGSNYGLSPGDHYIEALGNEPMHWRDRPIVDLCDEPLPERFKRLWLCDTEAWREKHEAA